MFATTASFPLPLGASERGSRSEAGLIRAAQHGSEEAIEELFRRYWPVGFRAAVYITRDAAAAEDIAQESFLAAMRNLDGFDRARPFGPWFKRMVANRAIDWTRARQIRSRHLEREREERARDVDRAPEGTPAAGGLPDDLAAAVGRLPFDQRSVVVLRYLLEYTPGEIAELLSVPRGTVNSRLRRGLDALRGEIGEEER
jgi:RNA polymerase sigma-70 factor (ECF subfamily)